MWGTSVRKSASTRMRPRSSASSPGRGEVEGGGPRDAAGGEEHHVGDDALAGLEGEAPPSSAGLSAISMDSTASPNRNVTFRAAHLVEQLVHDLAVEELERPVAPLDQGHRDPERGEDRRVLDPDDPAPTTTKRAGKLLQPDHVVAGQDDLAVALRPPADRRGWVPTAMRMCSAVTRRQPPSDRRERVRIHERRLTRTMPTSLRRSWFSMTSTSRAMTASTPAKSCRQVGRAVGPAPGEAIALPGQAGEGHHRLPEGLARDRAGVDARRRRPAALLDDGDAPAELGRLHRRALAGGPASDADEIEVERGAHSTRTGEMPQISSAYSRIVRSLENLPMPATFRIDFRVHAAVVAVRRRDALLARHVGGVVGEQQVGVAAVQERVDDRAEAARARPG